MKKDQTNARRFMRQFIAGLAIVGALGVATTPAMADHKHKNHGKHGNHGHSHQHGPQVIYVKPRPVYVYEPVYVAPPPVYYHPGPVRYERPTINIVLPIFD